MATVTETTPRAWVGCLGCYNDGRLNGSWVEGVNAGDISLAVKVKVGNPAIYGEGCLVCVTCGSDEFNVFDHEGYEGLIRGECSPVEAQEKAELIESAGDEWPMFRAYLSNCGSGDLNEARDAFIGEFDSWTEVADQLVDDCGLLSDAPALLVRYFDYEAYGRDLSYDGFEVDGFYFWSR